MKNYQAQICLEQKAQLGEGPLWDHDKQALLWVDILGNKLQCYDPETEQNQVLAEIPHVSTVVKRANGGLVITTPDGFYSFNEETKELSPINLPEQNNPQVRFNDGKCDPAGRFWAGTIGYETKPETAKLYCLEATGELSEKLDKITISNGICWNGDKMYYIDSPTKQIHRFDYDQATGSISNKHILFDVGPEGGFPDGMCLDQEGCLWVAFWGESMVRRISADGEELAQVHIPGASQVSACALGGKAGDTLFITTAAVEMEDEVNAGKLFSVKVDAKAAPTYCFAG
ncbi:hypothetical protein LNTAR_21295 [Lentisphaera araneosa HTCC2155]|uniref:SMP-30/Gluconolactonase/LRE-like region domain-containing protein n=1 Tax=Lentisphaera araneosa HTCC2155 TaxID=313628 RepID=A6DLZ3_9BACT|nr:SMP-30/gluconolactonase/LRE family protein [Lentisphaera araneosa]EDM27291.1 hypothetical protein LNTAR_21295 [Lentisphaera araneosa HTCC2155]